MSHRNIPGTFLKYGKSVRILHHLGRGSLKYWTAVISAKTPSGGETPDLKEATDGFKKINLVFHLCVRHPHPGSFVNFEQYCTLADKIRLHQISRMDQKGEK